MTSIYIDLCFKRIALIAINNKIIDNFIIGIWNGNRALQIMSHAQSFDLVGEISAKHDWMNLRIAATFH